MLSLRSTYFAGLALIIQVGICGGLAYAEDAGLAPVPAGAPASAPVPRTATASDPVPATASAPAPVPATASAPVPARASTPPPAPVPAPASAIAIPTAESPDLEPPGMTLRSALPVPVKKEPSFEQLDRSHQQQWHKYTAKLSGSMCPSCLLELENKLSKIAGVAFAKIVRDGTPGSTVDKPRNAYATIIYDAHGLDSEIFKACIKTEKYKPTSPLDIQLPDAAGR